MQRPGNGGVNHFFVDRVVAPFRRTSIEQTQAPVGIAFPVAKPPAKESIAPRHPVGLRYRIGHGLFDAGGQRRRNAFVGIDAQHPVMGGLVNGKLLLAAEAQPLLLNQTCTGSAHDLASLVRTAGVDNDDLIAKSDGCKAGTPLIRGVPGNEHC